MMMMMMMFAVCSSNAPVSAVDDLSDGWKREMAGDTS